MQQDFYFGRYSTTALYVDVVDLILNLTQEKFGGILVSLTLLIGKRIQYRKSDTKMWCLR